MQGRGAAIWLARMKSIKKCDISIPGNYNASLYPAPENELSVLWYKKLLGPNRNKIRLIAWIAHLMPMRYYPFADAQVSPMHMLHIALFVTC
jgi:hypothetical protein